MDVLPISLEARPFQGLLNGLIKKNFYSDKDITTDFLQQELYSGIEELEAGQFTNEINLYEKVSRFVFFQPLLQQWLPGSDCTVPVVLAKSDTIESGGAELGTGQTERFPDTTRTPC